MAPDLNWQIVISLTVFAAVYLFVAQGWGTVLVMVQRMEDRFDRVFNQQLLLNIPPRTVLYLTAGAMLVLFVTFFFVLDGLIWGIVGGLLGLVLPNVVVRYLAQRRAARLESQLVDGIVTLGSGARAGLNLVQCFELLAKNSTGPVQQEVSQMLREYQMGLDLNHAMRNAANRIGSSNYRLVFTALEMHRRRGGDTAESLDRIAESVREVQRLEGKLDALTAQGRSQARMMASMPILILIVLYGINPQGVTSLFVEPLGRILLIVAAAMIAASFYWIRRIVDIDI